MKLPKFISKKFLLVVLFIVLLGILYVRTPSTLHEGFATELESLEGSLRNLTAGKASMERDLKSMLAAYYTRQADIQQRQNTELDERERYIRDITAGNVTISADKERLERKFNTECKELGEQLEHTRTALATRISQIDAWESSTRPSIFAKYKAESDVVWENDRTSRAEVSASLQTTNDAIATITAQIQEVKSQQAAAAQAAAPQAAAQAAAAQAAAQAAGPTVGTAKTSGRPLNAAEKQVLDQFRSRLERLRRLASPTQRERLEITRLNNDIQKFISIFRSRGVAI